MREMLVVLAPVKGKLKDLHAGQARRQEQLHNLGRRRAQVLGDKLDVGIVPLQSINELDAGAHTQCPLFAVVASAGTDQ